MKLGGPPPKPPTTTAPVAPVAPVSAAHLSVPSQTLLHGQTIASTAAGQPSSAVAADDRDRPVDHRPKFRAVRHGKRSSSGHRGSTVHKAPSRPTRPGQTSAIPDEHSEENQHVDVAGDEEARRQRLSALMTVHASDREGAEQGNDGEGRHQERKFAAIRKSNIPAKRATEPEAVTRRVLAAIAAAASVEDLVGVLGGVTQGLPELNPAQGLLPLMLQVARTWLATREAGPSGGSATLESLRTALIQGVAKAAGSVDERHAAANIWLPVFLLNLDRPRTPAQRAQALDRLELLTRHAPGSPGAKS
jgi:hypothetical protein